MKCFVCLTATATRKVTVTKTDNSKWGFDCCEGCEPRHIPQGDVLIIESKPLNGGN